jgi:hypothetical protein
LVDLKVQGFPSILEQPDNLTEATEPMEYLICRRLIKASGMTEDQQEKKERVSSDVGVGVLYVSIASPQRCSVADSF